QVQCSVSALTCTFFRVDATVDSYVSRFHVTAQGRDGCIVLAELLRQRNLNRFLTFTFGDSGLVQVTVDVQLGAEVDVTDLCLQRGDSVSVIASDGLQRSDGVRVVLQSCGEFLDGVQG